MRLISATLGALLALTGPVLACSPSAPDPESDAQRAESVLLVRVTRIDPGRLSTLAPATSSDANSPARIASYEIEMVMKGKPPRDQRFAVRQAPTATLSSCGDWPFPQVGERWLLYQYGAPRPGIGPPLLSSLEGKAHWQWWQSRQGHTVKP
jgi:hypothetical protein